LDNNFYDCLLWLPSGTSLNRHRHRLFVYSTAKCGVEIMKWPPVVVSGICRRFEQSI
jgi:hypothetical protein